MKIAVVGATGNIGFRLSRKLLEAGHEVRALSRGGAKLEELIKLGVEPVVGSFHEDSASAFRFFEGADRVFTMVKTNWTDLHGHYPAVAARLVDALRRSSVELVVNLGSFGSEVARGTGHFVGFHDLEQGLNRYQDAPIIHLRAGYFMENTLAWIEPVARHGRFAYYFQPGLKLPMVATCDIADVAFEELTNPTAGTGQTFREVGGEDISYADMAAIIGRALGKPVEYDFVDVSRDDVGAEFVRRGGTEERWVYEIETHDAMNDGRVRLHPGRRLLGTTYEAFVREAWQPAYQQMVEDLDGQPEGFHSWLATLDR